jgi:hypothetical protein
LCGSDKKYKKCCITDQDDDFVSVAACELWKRYLPERPSIEMEDEGIKAYEDVIKVYPDQAPDAISSPCRIVILDPNPFSSLMSRRSCEARRRISSLTHLLLSALRSSVSVSGVLFSLASTA